MSVQQKHYRTFISVVAVILLAIHWTGYVLGKPANHVYNRCPDMKMLSNLQQSINWRRMQLQEVYCTKRQQMDGTPAYKCTPVICIANSNYQTVWQLGDKDFHKRLDLEIQLLQKASNNIRILQSQAEKSEQATLRTLRNLIESDIVRINNVMQVCYLSAAKISFKKFINDDFLKFPLSQATVSACGSKGRWQELTFLAQLIQLYNDMYNAIADYESL